MCKMLQFSCSYTFTASALARSSLWKEPKAVNKCVVSKRGTPIESVNILAHMLESGISHLKGLKAVIHTAMLAQQLATSD